MAYQLVVATPFLGYPEGTIISDPASISAVRASEYFSSVVQVSDVPIPPPEPPPPPLDLTALQAAIQALNEAQEDIENSTTVTQEQQAALQLAIDNLKVITAQQAAALNTADSVNQQQTAALQAALAQVNGLSTALDGANALNAQQNTTLDVQQSQIDDLSALVLDLQARLADLEQGGTGGGNVPPNLADDVPLAENDGDVITTAAGAELVGDKR